MYNKNMTSTHTPPENPIETPAINGLPMLPIEIPEVKAWLSSWVDASYQHSASEKLPENYNITAAQASVALLDVFNTRLQEMLLLYPEEYRTNQLIPVLVLARVLGAWQDTFNPDAQDWLNTRTNLGYYQQRDEKQWRAQFEGSRPSILTWLNRLPEALNYELDDKQIGKMSKSLAASTNAAPRFWMVVHEVWAKIATENPPKSIQDQLNICHASMALGLAIQKNEGGVSTGDVLPSFVLELDARSLSVPVRDYQKGWDHFVRTAGRQFALAMAKNNYPDGIPDNSNDRVAHIRLIEENYRNFEVAFEPWRWDGLQDASVEEKAQVWAWLTNWAPAYTWDQTIKAMGIHPPVEATGREYTGQTTLWWLNAPYEEKVVAAQSWFEKAEQELSISKSENNMDEFVKHMT